jgi:YVTN family beta-propeller protein
MSRKNVLTRALLYFLMLMFLMVISSCDWDDIEDFFKEEVDTYSISGHVTLNGAPAPDITIKLTGGDNRTAITDQNGNYIIDKLDDEEEYTVTPSSGSLIFTPYSIDVAIDRSNVEAVNFEAAHCCGEDTVNRVYISNYNDNSVSVIDSTTDDVITTIGLSHRAGISAFLPDLNRLYVTAIETNGLTIINTLTNAIITTITLPGRTGSIVADSTTNKIYVAEHGDNSLLPLGTRGWVLDGSTYALLNTITVGTNIQDLAIDRTNRRVFLTDFHTSASNPGLIFPINIDTDVALAGITCGVSPRGDAIHSTRHRAYATNSGGNSVTVINTTDNTIVTTIGVGNNPEAISVDETIDRGIVTNFNDNNVTLINTSDNTTVGSPISVGTDPRSVAVDSVTHRAYVVNFDSDNVSVINLQTQTVVDTITVGDGPMYVTVVE